MAETRCNEWDGQKGTKVLARRGRWKVCNEAWAMYMDGRMDGWIYWLTCRPVYIVAEI